MMYKIIAVISGFICFFLSIEVGRIIINGGGFFTLCVAIFCGFLTWWLDKRWRNEDKVKLNNSWDEEKKSYEKLVKDFEKNQSNIESDGFKNTSYTIEMDEEGNLSKKYADFTEDKTISNNDINKDDLQDVIDKLEKHKSN